MMHDSGGWWAVMWIAMIAMWVLFATLLLLLFTVLRRAQPHEDDENILARRLARGEINGLEYKSAVDALRSRREGLAYRILHGK